MYKRAVSRFNVWLALLQSVNFSVSVNFHLLPPPCQLYARTRVCKRACIHMLRRHTCWMQLARECVRGSTASLLFGIWESMRSRSRTKRYTLRQLAGVLARNTPEECTTPSLPASPSPHSSAGALAVPFSPPSFSSSGYARPNLVPTRRGTRGISANSMLSMSRWREVCERGWGLGGWVAPRADLR